MILKQAGELINRQTSETVNEKAGLIKLRTYWLGDAVIC